MKKIKPYVYENGGPIISMQVENEYGSLGVCDLVYLTKLRDIIREEIGDNILLFNNDNPRDQTLRCGMVPGALASVDFGYGSAEEMEQNLKTNLLFRANKGPLFNNEFYTGWLDHWGTPKSKKPTAVIAKALDWLLAHNVSVSMYMVHGGTSFGFGSGANGPPYAPNPTSYDYDAPISEAGDLTNKYYGIRDVVKKYFPLPSHLQVANSTKAAYGKMKMTPITVLDKLSSARGMNRPVKSKNPLTFEELGTNHGFVAYTTVIPKGKLYSDPSNLEIDNVHDRAYVYLDKKPIGKLTRMFGYSKNLPISNLKPGSELTIMLENQGRICYGHSVGESKGIVGNVKLNGRILTGWSMMAYPLSDVTSMNREADEIMKMQTPLEIEEEISQVHGQMTLWKGELKIPCSGYGDDSKPHDTFVRFNNWSKGVLWVNGINLGRYWPAAGSQETLYLPAPFLNQDCSKPNKFFMLETDGAPMEKDEQYIEFVDTPQLDGPYAQ